LKAKLELWVGLKVIDLVTQTAWMTFTEKLNYEGILRGLRRYSYFGIEVEGEEFEGTVEEIDRAIQLDSAFTNQNKHFYRLLAAGTDALAGQDGRHGDDLSLSVLLASDSSSLSSRGTLAIERDYPAAGRGERNGRLFSFDCLIRPSLRDRELPYMERLNGRLDGAKVTDIVAGEVWRITVEGADIEEAANIVDGMVVTRSRREGLLMNPHYQRYEVIASKELS